MGKIRFHRLGREPGNCGAAVGRNELRVLVENACEEPSPERTPAYEADAEFLERGEDLVLRVALHEAILGWESGDWLDSMCAPDRLYGRLRQAKVFDLSFFDQILYCAGNVLDRHVSMTRCWS